MFVVLSVTLPHTGHELIVIRGGSMEPTIPFGSLVVDAPATPAVGDVITLRQINGVYVTHRVIAQEGDFFTTKGDANEHPDPKPVRRAEVVGTVRLFIPFAGYLLGMLGDPWGIVSLICAWGAVRIWPRGAKARSVLPDPLTPTLA